jgi:hypothetical protein
MELEKESKKVRKGKRKEESEGEVQKKKGLNNK